VTAGIVQDRDGAKTLLEAIGSQDEVIKRLQLIWAEGRYRDELVTSLANTFGWKLEIVEKPKDQNGFYAFPKCRAVDTPIITLSPQKCSTIKGNLPIKSYQGEVENSWQNGARRDPHEEVEVFRKSDRQHPEGTGRRKPALEADICQLESGTCGPQGDYRKKLPK